MRAGVGRRATEDDLDLSEMVIPDGTTYEEALRQIQARMGEAPAMSLETRIENWFFPGFDKLADPSFIFQNYTFPMLCIWVVITFATPLFDKYVMGEEYEVDWSGKGGRFWAVLTGKVDLADAPMPKSDFELGNIADITAERQKEDGLLADASRLARRTGGIDEDAPGGLESEGKEEKTEGKADTKDEKVKA